MPVLPPPSVRCTDLILLFVLGEMGGYMGLLIGASWLTLCEIIDLIIYNMVMTCVNRVRNRRIILPARESKCGMMT